MAKQSLTPEQIQDALGEIASTADLARTVLHNALEQHDNAEDCINLILVAAKLLDQIGWTADHHGGGLKGGAENWILPPVWHGHAKPPLEGVS